MANAGTLLVALLLLRRRPRWDGFLIFVFAAWYGSGRVLEDFFRIDDTVLLGLSGSLLTALTLAVASTTWLVFVRRRQVRGTTAEQLLSPPAGGGDTVRSAAHTSALHARIRLRYADLSLQQKTPI